MKTLFKVGRWIWYPIHILLYIIFLLMAIVAAEFKIDLSQAHKTHRKTLVALAVPPALVAALVVYSLIAGRVNPRREEPWVILVFLALPWASLLNHYICLQKSEANARLSAAQRVRSEMIREACECLRSRLTVYMSTGADSRMLRFVIAADGTLAAPLSFEVACPCEATLVLPDRANDFMQLRVTVEETQAHGPYAAAVERWRNYYGAPDVDKRVRMSINVAQFRGHKIVKSELAMWNPLAASEVLICEEVNDPGYRDILCAAASAVAGRDVADPRIVGVDPFGFDVRTAGGVVRLGAEFGIADADDVIYVLEELAEPADADSLQSTDGDDE